MAYRLPLVVCRCHFEAPVETRSVAIDSHLVLVFKPLDASPGFNDLNIDIFHWLNVYGCNCLIH